MQTPGTRRAPGWPEVAGGLLQGLWLDGVDGTRSCPGRRESCGSSPIRGPESIGPPRNCSRRPAEAAAHRHPRGGWVAVSEEIGWLSHPEGLGPQVRRQGPPRVLLRGRTFPCRIQSGIFGVFGAERSGVSRTDEPLVSVWWKWLCTLSEGTRPLGVTWGPGQVFSLQASLSPHCPSGGRAGRCAVLSSPRKFIPEALFLGPDRGGNSKSPTV